jgi:monoamine oxidase
MMRQVDVAIVGGGAAGIAAARRLHAAGVGVLVIEAAGRLGGRAWTRPVEGHSFDLGCGWLHSADRNPWTIIARDLGFTIDETLPPWGVQAGELGFSRDDQRAALDAAATFANRLRERPPASDRASDALVPDGPWNGHLDAISGYVSGAALDRISVADLVAYDDRDSGVNWRVREGFGAAILAAAPAVAYALSTPVTAIDLDRQGVRLATPSGDVIARAVILTVSTDVLASDAIRLPAGLEAKREAAARLPLGLADKIVFAIDDAGTFDPDTQVIARPRDAVTGSYHLRPYGRPVIEGFFGGACARMLAAGSEADAVAFAVEELVGLFGSAIRGRLRPLVRTSWSRDPLVRGSYSHALPGHRDARAVLAAPVEDRLFFAGEACATDGDHTTAHGAYATGTAAADAVLRTRPGWSA